MPPQPSAGSARSRHCSMTTRRFRHIQALASSAAGDAGGGRACGLSVPEQPGSPGLHLGLHGHALATPTSIPSAILMARAPTSRTAASPRPPRPPAWARSIRTACVSGARASSPSVTRRYARMAGALRPRPAAADRATLHPGSAVRGIHRCPSPPSTTTPEQAAHRLRCPASPGAEPIPLMAGSCPGSSPSRAWAMWPRMPTCRYRFTAVGAPTSSPFVPGPRRPLAQGLATAEEIDTATAPPSIPRHGFASPPLISAWDANRPEPRQSRMSQKRTPGLQPGAGQEALNNARPVPHPRPPPPARAPARASLQARATGSQTPNGRHPVSGDWDPQSRCRQISCSRTSVSASPFPYRTNWRMQLH